MNLLGLDIATTTGWATWNGSDVSCGIIKPGERRPKDLDRGAVDPTYEGRLAVEFFNALKQIVIMRKIDRIGIEKPLVSNITNKKAVINASASWAGKAITYEDVGGTNFGTMFRAYSLQSQALALATFYDIPVYWASQGSWRKLFIGQGRAPVGTKNGSKWLKDAAKMRCKGMGIEVTSNDAAEAVGVLWWLRHHLDQNVDQGPLFRQESDHEQVSKHLDQGR